MFKLKFFKLKNKSIINLWILRYPNASVKSYIFIIFWIILSVFLCLYFIYYDYNIVLVLLVIFPGVTPFVPLVLPAPKYGWK